MPLDSFRAHWRSWNVWERTALGAWCVLVFALCFRALFWPHVHSVYPIFAEAARHWLAGVRLYLPKGDQYRYSPLVAALFIPFSMLPDGMGGVLWRGVSVGVYVTALAWYSRVVVPHELSRTQRALFFLLALPMSLGSLNNGQANILVLGLLVMAFAAVAVERWNLAAVCLALACLFKVYPIAVGLLLAAAYPRRFAGRLAIALLLGLLLPFLLQEPSYVWAQYQSWLEHLEVNDRQLLVQELWYRDFRLLSVLVGVPLSYFGYQVVQLVAGAGIAAFCLLGQRLGWPRRSLLTLTLGLGCCWMTVFGSATESCTYDLLAPVAAWLMLESWKSWLRGVVLGSYAFFLVPWVLDWFGQNRGLLIQGLQPAGALLLLTALLVLGVREMRRRADSGAAEAASRPAQAA